MIELLSNPPSNKASKSFEPDVIWVNFLRSVKAIAHGRILNLKISNTTFIIFSTVISESPFINIKFFFGV